MFNIFFTVLQNLMAFVEKLEPVEKVDLSDVEIGTLMSDKILEVTSLRKGSQQRLICGGCKMKEVSFDVRDIFNQTCVCKPLVPRT